MKSSEKPWDNRQLSALDDLEGSYMFMSLVLILAGVVIVTLFIVAACVGWKDNFMHTAVDILVYNQWVIVPNWLYSLIIDSRTCLPEYYTPAYGVWWKICMAVQAILYILYASGIWFALYIRKHYKTLLDNFAAYKEAHPDEFNAAKEEVKAAGEQHSTDPLICFSGKADNIMMKAVVVGLWCFNVWCAGFIFDLAANSQTAQTISRSIALKARRNPADAPRPVPLTLSSFAIWQELHDSTKTAAFSINRANCTFCNIDLKGQCESENIYLTHLSDEDHQGWLSADSISYDALIEWWNKQNTGLVRLVHDGEQCDYRIRVNVTAASYNNDIAYHSSDEKKWVRADYNGWIITGDVWVTNAVDGRPVATYNINRLGADRVIRERRLHPLPKDLIMLYGAFAYYFIEVNK